jgi:hypothetical protein
VSWSRFCRRCLIALASSYFGSLIGTWQSWYGMCSPCRPGRYLPAWNSLMYHSQFTDRQPRLFTTSSKRLGAFLKALYVVSDGVDHHVSFSAHHLSLAQLEERKTVIVATSNVHSLSWGPRFDPARGDIVFYTLWYRCICCGWWVVLNPIFTDIEKILWWLEADFCFRRGSKRRLCVRHD